MKKFVILGIGIFSGAVIGGLIGESIDPDHAGAGLLIGAVAFACFLMLSGAEWQSNKEPPSLD